MTAPIAAPPSRRSIPRQHWTDITRGLAAIAVIVHHGTALLAERGFTIGAWNVVDAALGPFRMPMLMALSGMVIARSLRRPLGQFVVGRLRSLGWPYLLWSVTTLAATGTISVTALLRIPLFSPTYLWFIWFLGAYSVIAFLLRRFPRATLPLAIASLVISSIVPDVHRASRFAFLLSFFLFGLWLSRARPSARVRIPLATAGLGLAVVGCVASIAGYPVRYDAAWAWAPAGLVLAMTAMYGWAPRAAGAPRSGTVRCLAWIGRNSLVFYVTHLSVLAMLVAALSSTGVDRGSGPIVLPVFALAALAVGSALTVARGSRVVDALFVWPARRGEDPPRSPTGRPPRTFV